MNRSYLAVSVILLLTAACQPSVNRFTVNGEIKEAEGKTLYLEQIGLSKIVALDSVKLDSKGEFSFSSPSPENCFDFYRLRVDRKSINLVIDSTETLRVTASLPTMQSNYQIEGSENCSKLKEIVLLQMDLMNNLRNTISDSGGIMVSLRQQRINELIEIFKTDLKNGYIFPDPSSPCAYYSLFISVDGQMVFDPQGDRDDAKCFAAVATQMDILYPDAVRTAHLHNTALKGMVKTRTATTESPESSETAQTLESLVEEIGHFEIELPDVKGKVRTLGSLKGKVVLLDFTAYKTDWSPNYNLTMRQLYNKYSSQGFEIFQVSVDPDESFWVNAAVNLPWVCVYDENALNSNYLKLYNVQSIPAAFLIDREGNLVDRPEDQKSLDEKIAKLLAE